MVGNASPAVAALVIGFTIQGLAIARALKREGVKVYALAHESGGGLLGLKHPVFYSDNVHVLYSKEAL